jgi:catechol 2,3-dioxygenase-like lactoylglutathione lyase family enzyme
MQSFWGTNLSLRLPRFGYRSVRFMVFTLLCLTQACASQQTDSGGYKSASIELNEAFRVGSTTKFDSDDDIGLVGRYHFATHTRDFDKARAFYRKLGYTEGVSGFPLTNTHQMARALGMFDVCQYELVKGEVISLPGSLNAAGIDLLQFKTPFNGEPPYELPNHLGMACGPVVRALRHSWRSFCFLSRS